MEDISGFGLKVILTASVTFPTGFELTQFADDGDSLDSPSVDIAEAAMGLNGDLVVWSKANPLALSVNVIPSSTDDKNLSILFQANRVGRGKQSARDRINIVASYPNGRKAVWSNGKIMSGMPANSIAAAGRMKTQEYKFAFENFVVT